MRDAEMKPMPPTEIDINETASRNQKVDPAKVIEALVAVRLLAAQGVAMSQFDLVLPFTRIRPSQQRQPRK